MPDPETVTDSTAAATTPPQGTDAPANDQTSAAAPPAKGFSEDFLKQLDEAIADPTRLPQDRREKLEAPFKSDYTRKTQELAEERKRFDVERQTTMEAVRKIIEARGTPPPGVNPLEERIKQLRDLAAAGDADAIEQLTEIKARQMFEPLQTQVVLKNAAETAISANPYVKANWNEILSTIQTDPGLSELAKFQNYKYADKVMLALGLEREAIDLRGKYQTSQKEIEGLRAKIVALEKERTASLPSTTSRAGTSTGAPPEEPEPGLMAAAKRAWVATGGRPEDFR